MRRSADKSADTFVAGKASAALPGTLWESHGTWHWRVKFPGAEKRTDEVLRMPFSGARIPAGASTRGVAEAAAWRRWEEETAKAAGDDAPVFTVNDLCDRWAAHANAYYTDSKEGRDSVRGLRPFRKMFGERPVEGMTHPDMVEYRARLASRDRPLTEAPLVLTTVNKYLGYAKRMFTWALDARLISATLKSELTAVANLKRGRGGAMERAPVTSVPESDVEAACRHMHRSVADMVRVEALCGARPGEMCQLSWDCIEVRGDVWVFRPGKHKNKHRNKPRVVVFGPKAQAILAKYQGAGPVFSPGMAAGDARACGKFWKVEAFARHVSRACQGAGIKPWHPNQLRHNCATAVRRAFGMAAAGAVLGHTSGLRVTDRYSFEAAEDEAIAAATPAMLALG